MDALLDSIVTGQINEVEPPYLLRFRGVAERPHEVQLFVSDLGQRITDGLINHNQRYPDDNRTILVEGA